MSRPYPLVDRSGVDDADTTLPTPVGVPAPMAAPQVSNTTLSFSNEESIEDMSGHDDA